MYLRLIAHLILQAQAAEQLGVLVRKEKRKQSYNQALINRYKHTKAVGSIHKFRHVPKPIMRVGFAFCANQCCHVLLHPVCCQGANSFIEGMLNRSIVCRLGPFGTLFTYKWLNSDDIVTPYLFSSG